MQMQEIKENFKKIVTGLNYEGDFEGCLIKMIDEYGGENPAEFFEAFSQLIFFLADHRELAIKAEAYDKIVEIEGSYNEGIEKLKQEYEMVEDTKQVQEDVLPYPTNQ